MPWENGAFFGALAPEEQAAGGAWIVGDRPHCSDPKFPGRLESRRFLVKLWLAHPDKYSGENYSMKDRLADKEWEYVRVLTGRLNCTARYDCDQCTYRLEYPAEGIDLPPYACRQWQLPGGGVTASGITICRGERGYQAGQGEGYELRYWEAGRFGDLVKAEPFEAPVNLGVWRYQLIVPFYGGCFLLPGLYQHGYNLMAYSYVFISAAVRSQWVVYPGYQSRGVIIYF